MGNSVENEKKPQTKAKASSKNEQVTQYSQELNPSQRLQALSQTTVTDRQLLGELESFFS